MYLLFIGVMFLFFSTFFHKDPASIKLMPLIVLAWLVSMVRDARRILTSVSKYLVEMVGSNLIENNNSVTSSKISEEPKHHCHN